MYKYLSRRYKIKSFKKTASYLRKQLSRVPSDPVLLTEMAWVKYNLFKDKEALEYANRAELYSPSLPHLWYVKGIILRSQENYTESIPFWDRILSTPIEVLEIKEGGKQIALSMQNDARFYKASCLYCLGKDKEAMALVQKHILNRKKGLASDFNLKEANDFLRILKFNNRNSDLNTISLKKDAIIVSGYSAGYMTRSQGQKVENHLHHLQAQKEWSAIIAYLKRKCREYPCDYWLKTELAEYLYLQNDKSCLKYAEAAYKIENDDMLVVYNYACALYLNEKYSLALEKVEIIIKNDINYIAYGEHGEGKRWAKKLMHDAEQLRLRICDANSESEDRKSQG